MDDDDQLEKLEQRTNWDGWRIVKYQGFWCPLPFFRAALSAQKYFKAKDSDIILSSLPKSGTTWLKALAFSVANRSTYMSNIDTTQISPLLTSNPHKVVPHLELNLYLNQENPDLEQTSAPRIFSTHMPFHALPNSIPKSGCKIIYICRNPMDQFISFRHFSLDNKFGEEDRHGGPVELDEAFDMFCDGVHLYGPFYEHITGYWDAHLKNPDKVLFLKYEDLKDDIGLHVRKIAEFMGCPFSQEEEERGLVEEICRVCSFDNLKNLEVNKSGSFNGRVKNSSFFRKGEVGDWANHLTPAMAERMDKLINTKLEGSGLTLRTHQHQKAT
ncbi:hypothetical protein ABFS82_14G063600 [Erythranthe guttata]|uniref:Sulfotransferase n=1 Tax=Erythranthe guttata TaxID=4155 RepID=A0A022RAZ5_ERYGU|nr:PREDICTED: cytosolic sulfotransferase 15-like [Erythranthe guttata]EYU36903.1 hypothetical protein MIMGU_mgv1a024755mg [Erythranthe guttata]|eukprot:XP_012838066.1 PREDICTED: cytosolic sulfotransferase 15-like [Erythranthe guttata]